MHSNGAWNTSITCHQLPTKSLETVFRKSSITTLTGNKTCLLVVAVVMIWKCRSSKCWWWSRGVCTFQVSREVGCSRLQGQDERRVCKCWGRRITTARDEDGEIGDWKKRTSRWLFSPFCSPPPPPPHTRNTHTTYTTRPTIFVALSGPSPTCIFLPALRVQRSEEDR